MYERKRKKGCFRVGFCVRECVIPSSIMFILSIVNLLYHVSSRASEPEKEPGNSNHMNGKPNKLSKHKNVQIGIRTSQLRTESFAKKISGCKNEQHRTLCIDTRIKGILLFLLC